ncbi:transcriptional regulator MelR [Reinekea blandensis]|uniref:Regulator of melibiose operon n=1 Tax=Reinekea blandensis MED297 TaxID=314283 RepID=A4BGH9_9GAMM|nr:transcriptional regulator MelR [Reinekea blandensis]EAR08785.1 regulator of melibiose operon [Reinekea sp. MED297] [Reinekea blandensis MED297]
MQEEKVYQPNDPVNPLFVQDNIYVEEREPECMAQAHWHSHIEVNIPYGDGVEYDINGKFFRLPERHLGLFWAAIPHQLTNPGKCREMFIAYIPMQTIIAWSQLQRLYRDIVSQAVLHSRVEYPMPIDQMRRLVDEFNRNDDALKAVVNDELQLMLKRASAYGLEQLVEPVIDSDDSVKEKRTSQSQKIQAMLEFIASNYKQPIAVTDVAEHVHLHPKYAMQMFKNLIGIPMKQYINRMRLMTAKDLLRDTERSIMDIALTVGFNSNNRFYIVFRQYEQCTPKEFRNRYR